MGCPATCGLSKGNVSSSAAFLVALSLLLLSVQVQACPSGRCICTWCHAVNGFTYNGRCLYYRNYCTRCYCNEGEQMGVVALNHQNDTEVDTEAMVEEMPAKVAETQWTNMASAMVGGMGGGLVTASLLAFVRRRSGSDDYA